MGRGFLEHFVFIKVPAFVESVAVSVAVIL